MADLLAGRQLGMPRCRRSCRSSHAGANPAFRAALPRSQLLRPLNRNVRTLGSGTEGSKPACSSGVSGDFRPHRPDAVAGLPRPTSRPTEVGRLAAAASPFGPTTVKVLGVPVSCASLIRPAHSRQAPRSSRRRIFSQTLGTALGDWMADTGGLGREPSSRGVFCCHQLRGAAGPIAPAKPNGAMCINREPSQLE
jgi:hypothetical protein